MTEQTQPTDAEILDAVKHLGAAMLSPVEVARAVLAKWGTPAGAGELVACTYGDNGYACCEGGPCRADVHNASITTPQPTQAQAGAVPLTDEWIDAAAKKLAECMEYPWEFMPEPGRKNMRKHAQDVIGAAYPLRGKQ